MPLTVKSPAPKAFCLSIRCISAVERHRFLRAHQIGRIIEQIFQQFKLEASAEITLEVNPGTVTLESLKAYRKSGVTRLNIGVQSFQDSFLQWLGRMHSALEAKDAIRWARAAGFDQIGMDLIYGIPGQNRQTLD